MKREETANNHSDDFARYQLMQEKQQKEWEALCKRCGACCGTVDGDLCEHLRKDKDGQYFCNIYEYRFGLQKTISGKEIRCVSIRSILHQSWPGDQNCAYKKQIKQDS